jgi:hypothetical protein
MLPTPQSRKCTASGTGSGASQAESGWEIVGMETCRALGLTYQCQCQQLSLPLAHPTRRGMMIRCIRSDSASSITRHTGNKPVADSEARCMCV